ncbi:G-protein coupled receptor GRL101 [Aplysia californica]|uniref:G-protein coupled receptor GRL101 n=1 Tax=Aplysia californica TaxID=6500 RepID=A0ABM1VPG7_APLCA|nr:G-protein coupled receptor GRL101 [Aplysia californica]XP_035824307.1 G-protein coupled receptor GRL101 [Aplysia californica]XP_035824308.1 G-protein coupled receptor GRL101 [Aplysia californica]XP_035824309.1 G-protein coupled receptor GRL101 [Aplysia californica]XP_035824310.1 G-protein coupled receptor GRL101 [Aplysia californica]
MSVLTSSMFYLLFSVSIVVLCVLNKTVIGSAPEEESSLLKRSLRQRNSVSYTKREGRKSRKPYLRIKRSPQNISSDFVKGFENVKETYHGVTLDAPYSQIDGEEMQTESDDTKGIAHSDIRNDIGSSREDSSPTGASSMTAESRSKERETCSYSERSEDDAPVYKRRRQMNVLYTDSIRLRQHQHNMMTGYQQNINTELTTDNGNHFCYQMTNNSGNNVGRYTKRKSEHIDSHVILIQDRTQCSKPTNVTASTVSYINVTVKTCCITFCAFKLHIEVEEDKHMLLNFPYFNVPGLNLLKSDGIGNCTESLDVIAESVDKNNPGDVFENKIGSYCGIKKPTSVFVEHNAVNLVLRMFNNDQCIDKIDFDVEVVPCRKFPHESCNSTKYVKLGTEKGYISSPGLVENQNYPNSINCEWEVSVRDGMLILLDPAIFLLSAGDVLTILPLNPQGRKFPTKLTMQMDKFIQPVVLPSNKAVIQFSSDHMQSGQGFNISYTSVNGSDFMPMDNNNTLDCSGNVAIPECLRCDHYRDCLGGEDEEGCEYRRPGCWPEGFYNDRFCYRIIENEGPFSWNEAAEKCEKEFSANLLTITTKQKREFVNGLISYHAPVLSKMFLGLVRMRLQQVRQTYRRLWQWSDRTTALYLPDEYRYEGWSTCSLLHGDYFYSIDCTDVKENVSFICETEMIKQNPGSVCGVKKRFIQNQSPPQINTFKCSSGELISEDRECNRVEDCFDGSDELDCNFDLQEEQMFSCETGEELVMNSAVCDGIGDCTDESDESFCRLPEKNMLGPEMCICTNRMVLNKTFRCDGREDCLDASDEEDCSACGSGSFLCPMIACLPKSWQNDLEIDCPIRDIRGKRAPEPNFPENIFESTPPPGIVKPDGYGKVQIEKMDRHSQPCPETHQKCVHGYCIPIYMWCNGQKDCPHGEDEEEEMCAKTCPGLYKCKKSKVCLHSQHVCDGQYQCPNHDDENLCQYLNVTSPPSCTRKQMDFTCTSLPDFQTLTHVKFLNVSRSGIKDFRLVNVARYALIFLDISFNNIHSLTNTQLDFLNLRTLNARSNAITSIDYTTFKNCPVLEKLVLADNKITNLSLSYFCNMKSLQKLDLSGNPIRKLQPFRSTCTEGSSTLRYLNLRNMGLIYLNDDAFCSFPRLKSLLLEGNSITLFTPNVFKFQGSLNYLTTDNFRLCCSSVKPKSLDDSKCLAPFDEISSCDDILRAMFLRVTLWVMVFLTLSGNVSVIIYRIFFDKCIKYSFRIIITCLSASDLIMGVYLVIIGSADVIYRDRYFVVEREWKESVACQVAGFLCVLSSETSAMFILLVTIDRFTAIAFPLRIHLHFTKKSASIACAVVWSIGVCIAAIPLVPPWNQWNFYSQKAIGVPLPITRFSYPGFDYAFSIFILFNMAIFILVILGQIGIYLSVRLLSVPRISEQRLYQDTAIAKRLVLVVFTDCLCWFPICVMGLAACADFPVPGEMYVVASVILMPANSAINPFLYTANAVLVARKARRRKKKGKDSIGLRPANK